MFKEIIICLEIIKIMIYLILQIKARKVYIVFYYLLLSYPCVKNIHLKISPTSFGDISLNNVTVTMFKNNSFANSSGAKFGLAIP